VESCVTFFAHIVIGNLCASMKGALRHIIVESSIQFIKDIGITVLRWVLHPTVEAHVLDFYILFFPQLLVMTLLLSHTLVVLELEAVILNHGIHVFLNVPTCMSYL
jgi:hypothetical protein